MPSRHVMLVFGGESSEHDVSIASAHNVYAALDDDRYDITLCYIDRTGKWWLVDSIDELSEESSIVADFGEQAFLSSAQLIKPDVVLPILHGKGGEDGTIQGLCQLLHIPIVGPSLLSAAVTMDKDMTKRLVKDAGVPVVDWVVWNTENPYPNFDNITAKLGKTIFVKPSNAGSSVGVSKVTTEHQFTQALDDAGEYDVKVLIEGAVHGSELQIAVLGGNNPKITEICEIEIGAEFHDFEDKYNPNSKAKFYIPARLTSQLTELVKGHALKSYRAVGGQGMARIDFFIDADENVYLNEINSIPGFTSVSVYPKLWRHEGILYSQLIDKLIDDALSR